MEAIKDIVTIGTQYYGKGLGTIVAVLCKFHSAYSQLRRVDHSKKARDELDDLKEWLQDQLQNANVQLETLHYDVSTLLSKSSVVIDWVEEQKKKGKATAVHIFVEDVVRVSIAIVNSVEKFQSGDLLEITRGVLDIISSAAPLVDKRYGSVIGVLCSIISTILTKRNPQQPSVVDQLANVVHGELVRFNKSLQDQKYEGLIRRVSDQNYQLRMMKPGEKLDDPNLWNDYVQFMGELSNRFESPLPFKYKDNLTQDPDVADFVTAVEIYCEAYCCFMALLIAAKGKFAELGSAYKEDEDAVDRKISCQTEDAKEKLSFLSEAKYLTFLGRLPHEGGKLTKIVVLSRNMRAKSRVEAVRSSLGLMQMPDLDTVEAAASKVARQSVKGRVKRNELRPEVGWLEWLFRPPHWFQVINETNFPMKIFLGGCFAQDGMPIYLHISGGCFVQDVQPRSSFQDRNYSKVSAYGYINIYQNGNLDPNIDPSAGQLRVIEGAFSTSPSPQINIQDKTGDEFSRGRDTYNKMTSGKAKTLYWFENGVHIMARGEIISVNGTRVYRFLFQDFDPCSVED